MDVSRGAVLTGHVVASVLTNLIAIAALMSLTAGCAQDLWEIPWHKDGATREDLSRDRGECMSRRERIPSGYGRVDMAAGHFFRGCMRARGWTEG